MSIEQWLDRFHKAWVGHDIVGVLSLFTDYVEYWETPHLRLASKDELSKEWEGVKEQQKIDIHTRVFCSSDDNKHAVLWKLSYVKNGKQYKSGGTYLISLDETGRCNYFHYTGEQK
jgi:hypothetical protein